MQFLYEALFTPYDDGSYEVYYPDLDIYTQGDNLNDAAFMAYDALRENMIVTLAQNETPEPSIFGHKTEPGQLAIGFMVDVDGTEPERYYMTVAEAADYLDVTPSRIHAMIKAGQLQSEKVGSARMVLTVSVRDAINNRRPAGRPPKQAADKEALEQ